MPESMRINVNFTVKFTKTSRKNCHLNTKKKLKKFSKINYYVFQINYNVIKNKVYQN